MFYLENFLEHLKTIHFSLKTIEAYSYLVNNLKSHFEENGIDDVKDVTEKRIGEYVQILSGRNGNSRYLYTTIIRLKKYFAFLEADGVIFISPLRDYPNPKFLRRSYSAINQKKIRFILDTVKADNSFLIRGKAILELAYSSALRPREIYNVKITDIDFKEGTIFISKSKGEKDRLVPVGKTALKWVTEYMENVRPRYIKNENHGCVFVSHKTGKPLTVWGLRSAVQETVKRNGFFPFPPYSLRSASATALFLGGMDIAYIRKLLGHVELRTTQSYLNIHKERLGEELFRKHPRNTFSRQGGNI